MYGIESPPLRLIRFGSFEVDLEAEELRKNGLRLKLEPKAFQALTLLLHRAGHTISRREFYRTLWPDTNVRFDRSLNTVINRVREVLGDSAASPRFVQTLSRRGYRFVASPSLTVTAAHSSAIRSMAVLPFEWTSAEGGRALDSFGDGLTEALIDTLARIPDLRVLAAGIVSRYRGRPFDPSSAARELGVGALLTGRVTRQGRSLRIVVELIDGADGAHLWGGQYEGPMQRLAAVRESLSRDVAEKLRLRFTAESQPAEDHPPENSPASEECLRGFYFRDRMTRVGLEQALASFESAIRRDPAYAPAYAGLADAYQLQAVFSLSRSADALLRSREAALLALALDDNLAAAHSSLAAVKAAHDWDWAGAVTEFQRALDLDPRDPTILQRYAAFLSALGRAEEALLAIQRALALDPLSLGLGSDLAWNFYLARHCVPAIEHCRRTLEMEPTFSPARLTLALALQQAGQHREALATLREIARTAGDDPAVVAALGYAHAVAGSPTPARRALKRLQTTAGGDPIPPCLRAIVHAGLGEIEPALDALDTAAEQRDIRLVWLKVDPRYDPLRPHPQFQRLLGRLGLA
jgi:TolB-like protein/Tfp pilus assembly protein PilF